MKMKRGFVMWVDEDSAVVYCGGSWRISLSKFKHPPEKDQDVWLEVEDNFWKATHLRVLNEKSLA